MVAVRAAGAGPGRAVGLTVGGQRYVIAGLIASDWAKNARTAGWGMLSRGRRTTRVTLTELTEHDGVIIYGRSDATRAVGVHQDDRPVAVAHLPGQRLRSDPGSRGRPEGLLGRRRLRRAPRDRQICDAEGIEVQVLDIRVGDGSAPLTFKTPAPAGV